MNIQESPPAPTWQLEPHHRVLELRGFDQSLDLRRGEFTQTPAHLYVAVTLADLRAVQRSLGNPPLPELAALPATDLLGCLPLQLQLAGIYTDRHLSPGEESAKILIAEPSSKGPCHPDQILGLLQISQGNCQAGLRSAEAFTEEVVQVFGHD